MRIYYVYILLCSDNSYYTGMTNNLERRLFEHKSGKSKGSYTFSRLPIELKWYLECSDSRDAIQYEKKIKGWSHRKKKALIDENWSDLVKFSKNYSENEDSRI
ncbi:GIY-YIG nuclease family protein [Polaribacter sp. 11A2H]|uniref:GIY-YIG nuclease family protein n=1 Tax=Polaribacter sp. 11A2H TaxID=2687290 RepID=UPI00140B99DC|nr:GIY-YIG nuclease family protein [Polaribacter sp. 11A2H]